MNEFSASLTKAKVCYWTLGAIFWYDELVDNSELRENSILFTLALSAAAQHLIHAAFNHYTYCEKARTSWGLSYQWEEWKAAFKEAEIFKNVRARNDAGSAVVAMDMAWRLYSSPQMKGERQISTR